MNRGKRKGRGCSTPRPREGVGREANPRTPQKVLQEPYGGPLPISSFPFAAHHLVLGVDVGRVDTFAAIDQVPVAALGVDDVVAITAILPILAVATAYPCRGPVGLAPRRRPHWRRWCQRDWCLQSSRLCRCRRRGVSPEPPRLPTQAPRPSPQAVVPFALPCVLPSHGRDSSVPRPPLFTDAE